MGKLKGQTPAIIQATCFLLLLSMVITLAVAGTNALTADRIAEQAILARNTAMERVLPANHYELVHEEPLIFRAENTNGDALGYVLVTSANGYGGAVVVMTSIVDGAILQVEVLDATSETPGLGQVVSEEHFTSRFAGLAERPSLSRGVPTPGTGEVQSITGSTISAAAVIEAVSVAMAYYEIIGGGR